MHQLAYWQHFAISQQIFDRLLLSDNIKTHDSELRGQEEAGSMQQTSELFTHSIILYLKSVNDLNKCLVIKDSACSNHIE